MGWLSQISVLPHQKSSSMPTRLYLIVATWIRQKGARVPDVYSLRREGCTVQAWGLVPARKAVLVYLNPIEVVTSMVALIHIHHSHALVVVHFDE
jgi:hypothetical protein